MSPRIVITLVQAYPRRTSIIELSLPPGAAVADALQVLNGAAEASIEPWSGHVGIFGQRCSPQRVLQDGDRVELYRPLTMDAKSARRQRAKSAKSSRDDGRE